MKKQSILGIVILLSALVLATGCGNLLGAGGTGAKTPTLAQQVVTEMGASLSTSASRGLAAKGVSITGLTTAEIAAIKAAALDYITGAGLLNSAALDKILDAMIKGVAENLSGADLNTSKILAVAASSAVKSVAAAGRETMLSSTTMSTESIIATITATAVQQAGVVCGSNAAAVRELRASIVRESIAALDSAVTVSAAESASAINKIMTQVVAVSTDNADDLKAIVSAATAASAGLISKPQTAGAAAIASAATVAIVASGKASAAALLQDIAAEISAAAPPAEAVAIAAAITKAAPTVDTHTIAAVTSEAAPTAVALADHDTVSTANATVTLSSTGSTTAGVDYAWAVLSGSATLSAATGASVTATLPIGGTYVFQLTVNNTGGYKRDTATAIVNSTFSAVNAGDYVNTGIAYLATQNFTAAKAQFVLALAKDPANADAKVWKAFIDMMSLSVNPDIVSLFRDNNGFSGYPSNLNTLLAGTWFNKQIYNTKSTFAAVTDFSGLSQFYVHGTFTPDSSAGSYYVVWHISDHDSISSSGSWGSFAFSDSGPDSLRFDWSDTKSAFILDGSSTVKISDVSAGTKYTVNTNLADLTNPMALLPSITAPAWAPKLADNSSISAYAYSVLTNLIDRNPGGLNGIVDKVLSGAFGSDFTAIIAAIKSLPDGASVAVPANLINAYAHNITSSVEPTPAMPNPPPPAAVSPKGIGAGPSLVINKDELLAFAGGLQMMKGLVQYVASYNLSYPIGLAKFDFGDPTVFKDTNHDGLPDVVSSLMAQTAGPFVTSSGLLSDRSQAMRDAAKATILQAELDLSTSAGNIITELGKADGVYAAFFSATATYTAANLATDIGTNKAEADKVYAALSTGGAYDYAYQDSSKVSHTVRVIPAAIFAGPVFSLSSLFMYSGGKPIVYFATGSVVTSSGTGNDSWVYATAPTPSTAWTTGVVNQILIKANTVEIAKVWPTYNDQMKDNPYLGTFSSSSTAGIPSTSGEWTTAKWMFGF